MEPRTASAGDDFPRRYVNRHVARERYGTLADDYARFLLVGDPLADALVAWLRGGGDRRLFERALEDGLDSLEDPPPPLRAFFEAVERVPPWVDRARLDLGARTYQRLGKASLFVLSAWSLMNGYHSAPAVKPLAWTAQLDRMAPRRLAETGRFVIETIQEGGLERFAPGFRIAVRVRLMHALVRASIASSPRWRTADWGVPINQADMAGTIIEFSLLVLAGTRAMGFRFTREEADAVVHLWRYSGYVSGVDERLLQHFTDELRGARFAEMVKLIQPGPDQDSIDLAAALRKVPRQNAATPAEKLLVELVERYHDGLTWAFNGAEVAGNLRIPNARWRHAIVPTRWIVGGLERFRIATRTDARFAAFGNRGIREDIERMLAGREPTFTPA